MTTATLTLTEFLLARMAEDEQRAKTGAPFETWDSHEDDDYFMGPNREAWHSAGCGYAMLEMGDLCSCGVPARVLAECAAKRRIVELQRDSYVENDVEYWALNDALRLLALPYADHADYREEWRV